MDLESVADELYSLPRDGFTAARNAAAARARKQGHRELAKRIGALRQPSTAAWLANLLAREHPDEVRALVELGAQLREAQHRRHGDELRRLSQRRHERVHALVQQAQALARAAGHPAGAVITRELVNTFTAAVNSSTAAQALTGARLIAALDPADAAAETFAGIGAVDDPNQSGTAGDAGPASVRDGRPSLRDERLDQDMERLRTEAAEADAARDAAWRALTCADRAADDAAAARHELRARLAAAEQAEREARHRAQVARRDFEVADRTARAAQRRVHDPQPG